jgi:tetratricopeptide (TPR) repeat protein
MNLMNFSKVNLVVAAVVTFVGSGTCAQERRHDLDRQLGPLVLLRELSAGAIETLLAEAEGQYRYGLLTQAMEGFRGLLELAPNEPKAWLRMGNLHQQAGATGEALLAYQRAIDLPTSSRDHELVRDKALLNVGLIHLEQAERALGLLEASTNSRSPRQFDTLTDLEKDALDAQIELRDVIIETQKRADSNLGRVHSTSRKTGAQVLSRKP